MEICVLYNFCENGLDSVYISSSSRQSDFCFVLTPPSSFFLPVQSHILCTYWVEVLVAWTDLFISKCDLCPI